MLRDGAGCRHLARLRLHRQRAGVRVARRVETAYAEPGTEVEVVWGEEPISHKPAVEPHRQVEIRATVAPAPYLAFARENYRAK